MYFKILLNLKKKYKLLLLKKNPFFTFKKKIQKILNQMKIKKQRKWKGN